MNEQFRQWVENIRFTPTRGRRHGYDMGEVDRFLDELEALARRGEPIDEKVSEVRFSETKLREGYAIDDVTRFLGQVVTAYETGIAPGLVEPLVDTGPNREFSERILGARFTPTFLLRPGYDMGQVDGLLDELGSAVASGEPIAHLVDDARLSTTRLCEGYSVDEVDAFLAQLVADYSARGALGGSQEP